MGKMDLKRLQGISHRMNPNQTEIANQFVSGLRAALAKRGYRADLSIATDARSTMGKFAASVAFNPELGHPAEEDLVTLVAQAYPDHEIDWGMAEVDSDQGLVMLMLQPAQEVIPVNSIASIPPEFKAIGTGLYKRAVDSTVSEIWSLKKTSDGLALYRNESDIEVNAEENELKAGDIANTPYGPGRIVRFDSDGNAFVQVGNQKRLVAAKDLGMYSIEKEKGKLTDYFAQAYGDREFAEALTKDYDTRKKGK